MLQFNDDYSEQAYNGRRTSSMGRLHDNVNGGVNGSVNNVVAIWLQSNEKKSVREDNEENVFCR